MRIIKRNIITIFSAEQPRNENKPFQNAESNDNSMSLSVSISPHHHHQNSRTETIGIW